MSTSFPLVWAGSPWVSPTALPRLFLQAPGSLPHFFPSLFSLHCCCFSVLFVTPPSVCWLGSPLPSYWSIGAALLFHGANWFQASLLSFDHRVVVRGACFLASCRKLRARAPRMISFGCHFLKGMITEPGPSEGISGPSLPASPCTEHSFVGKFLG